MCGAPHTHPRCAFIVSAAHRLVSTSNGHGRSNHHSSTERDEGRTVGRERQSEWIAQARWMAGSRFAVFCMSSPSVHDQCQNCSAQLEGPFCHRCGQHDVDVSRSFHHVLLEALENFFHFDAKFFRNVVTLLFQPGALSADYNAGKRVSQMPPFRFYLFISVLFFFVGYLTGRPMIRLAADTPSLFHSVATEASETNAPAVAQPVHGVRRSESTSKPSPESFWEERIHHFTEHREEAVEELAHAFPKILIFCLPLFALFTRLLFPSQMQHYLQYLIVAVHFHTFIFLWKLVGDGWVEVLNLVSSGLAYVATGAVTAWFIIYPVLMFRRLYGRPWLPTIVRSLAVFVVYYMTIVLCFTTTAGLIFFFQ